MKPLIIETRGLKKTFKKQTVLDGVDLQVPVNTVYGLLGPNGAGKSTLLKLLTGIARPTAGEILMEGHLWTRADLANIGALIETPPIYENLSARENLRVRAYLLEVPEARINEVLDMVGLGDTGKKKAGQFSLGMKQRLGIALALLGEPKLLILDEPTNGLDPLGMQELRTLIRSFPQKGITVVVSSHLLSEIEQMADVIGILCKGHLAYQDAVNTHEDLEALFMEIVAKEGTR